MDSSLDESVASKDGHHENSSDKYPAPESCDDRGLKIEICQDHQNIACSYENPGFKNDENSEGTLKIVYHPPKFHVNP